jgi:hypothetical protein
MAVTASHAARRAWRACGRQHSVVRRRLEHDIEPAFGGNAPYRAIVCDKAPQNEHGSCMRRGPSAPHGHRRRDFPGRGG